MAEDSSRLATATPPAPSSQPSPSSPPAAAPPLTRSARVPRLDATLRVLVALLGTIPLTVLALSLFSRAVFGGTALAEVLALLLLVPVWITACSICLASASGLRVTAWVAALTAAAALLARFTA